METVTSGNIDGFTSRKDLSIIVFRADWCPFCRKFRPLYEAYEGMVNARMAEAVVNEDENPLWDRFNIQVVPTIVAFRSGKEIARRNGVAGVGLDESDLKALISKL